MLSYSMNVNLNKSKFHIQKNIKEKPGGVKKIAKITRVI